MPWHVGYIGWGEDTDTFEVGAVVPFRDSTYGVVFPNVVSQQYAYLYRVDTVATEPTGYRVRRVGEPIHAWVSAAPPNEVFGLLGNVTPLSDTVMIVTQYSGVSSGPWGMRVLRRDGLTLSLSDQQHSSGTAGLGESQQFIVRTSDTTFARGYVTGAGSIIEMCSVDGDTISVDSTQNVTSAFPTGDFDGKLHRIQGASGGYLHGWRQGTFSNGWHHAHTFTHAGVTAVDSATQVIFPNIGAGPRVLDDAPGMEMLMTNSPSGTLPTYYDGADWHAGATATSAEFPLGISDEATPWRYDWIVLATRTIDGTHQVIQYARTTQVDDVLTLQTGATDTAVSTDNTGWASFGFPSASRARQGEDLVVILASRNPPGPTTIQYGMWAFDCP